MSSLAYVVFLESSKVKLHRQATVYIVPQWYAALSAQLDVLERVNAYMCTTRGFCTESTSHVSLVTVHYCIDLVCAVCELE